MRQNVKRKNILSPTPLSILYPTSLACALLDRVKDAEADPIAQKGGARISFKAKLKQAASPHNRALPPKGNRCLIITRQKFQAKGILDLLDLSTSSSKRTVSQFLSRTAP
jgi:hypothetical protein